LDAATRAFMESRFCSDFGSVRIHTDSRGAESARAVNAWAYTVGQDIVFASGRYSPYTKDGQTTLAHELTHTMQQGGRMQPVPSDLGITDPADSLETEAHHVASAVVNGAPPATISVASPAVARDVDAGAATKKKVTVNVTNFKDAGGSIGSALTYANTNVYNQAATEIQKGKEVTLDETKSKAILGNDLIVDEYTDPASPTGEETNLLKENQSAGAITAYFVKGFDKGSIGESFWASSGSGLIGFVVGSTRSDNTFSHELGHVLLDDGGHNVPDATYLMHATAPNPTKLTPQQITKIKNSPFAK
jgi:Zn-dependent peptidase ImmA (M78 family)